MKDTDKHPSQNTKVIVNCGKTVNFVPVAASWDDGRICKTCLKIHRKQEKKKFTFGVLQC
jgi:hypothetical protein